MAVSIIIDSKSNNGLENCIESIFALKSLKILSLDTFKEPYILGKAAISFCVYGC